MVDEKPTVRDLINIFRVLEDDIGCIYNEPVPPWVLGELFLYYTFKNTSENWRLDLVLKDTFVESGPVVFDITDWWDYPPEVESAIKPSYKCTKTGLKVSWIHNGTTEIKFWYDGIILVNYHAKHNTWEYLENEN